MSSRCSLEAACGWLRQHQYHGCTARQQCPPWQGQNKKWTNTTWEPAQPKATNTKAAPLQPLSHSKGGIHNHFVMSGENTLLKTFLEPQLAKFSSFTGNIDIWVFLIQKKLLMKSSISGKIDTIIIHYFPVMWNKPLTNFCDTRHRLSALQSNSLKPEKKMNTKSPKKTINLE